jgi:MerR family transcriptional regulator, repressor of the yfmOP operon
MTEQKQLTKILTLVELSNARLDKLDRDIQETNKRIEDEVKRWDERFFQLVKDQGTTARTIIIGAATVVVLSPALGAVGDFVEHLYLK